MGCSLEDATLPTLLACLSKAAAERAATGLRVPVQPTGKATRAAIIARVGQGRWIYPTALFSGPSDGQDDGAGREQRDAGWTPDPETTTGAGDGDAGSVPSSVPDETPALDAAAMAVAELVDGTPAGEPDADPDAAPAEPPPRRRRRKDSGEARPAA